MKYILGEIIVIIFLVIAVDHLPYILAWLPFIIYNILYLRKIVMLIDWDNFD